MRHWRGFGPLGKRRLRSGLRITSALPRCTPKSPKSIEDTTTKASIGQTNEHERAKDIESQIHASDDQSDQGDELR
jgi:hypothetical protein